MSDTEPDAGTKTDTSSPASSSGTTRMFATATSSPSASSGTTGMSKPAPSSPVTSSGTTKMFAPDEPKFGGLIQTGTDTWSAWIGGKPTSDWSGLENPKPSTIQPNQYRASSVYSQAKGQSYRIQGITTQFTREANLLTFQKKVMKHLNQHGLDTITYLQDPVDPNQTISVINNHSQFDLDAATKEGNDLKDNYSDGYSHQAMEDAKIFLLNSISEDLETQLYQNCNEEDSFIAYWMNLVHIVNSVTID